MTSAAVEQVLAWEALDSRGRPTVGCRLTLRGGGVGRVVVPSGASTGSHEARELRDGGARYEGYGVRTAVHHVNTLLGPKVHGMSVQDQAGFDAMLEAVDGEPDLGRLGSNAVLALSLAALLAAADAERQPLWRFIAADPNAEPLIPMPMVNILSGGAHAGQAIDLQDLLAVPIGASSFAEAIEWVSRIRRQCAVMLDRAGGWSALVADEGGLAARLDGNENALQILTAGIERAGFRPGVDAAIAIDVAASQLTSEDRITLASDDERLTAQEWTDRLGRWVQDYPVVSVEDVLGEDDWDGWTRAATALANIQVVGDDLFATNLDRLNHGIEVRAANSVLVKVNQAGTVSRAAAVLRRARAAGWATVVSARSGDTEDTWLSDLAVGWGAGQIKVGSTMRSERTAKWNRLLELEATGPARFAGRAALAPRGDIAR